jgi:hypothetical protein
LTACGSSFDVAQRDGGPDSSRADVFVDSSADAPETSAPDAAACTATVLASGETWPGGLASDGTSLYWVNSDLDGSVRTCALDGTGLHTMSGSLAGSPTPAIAASSAYLYWGIDEGLLQGCSLPSCTNGPNVLTSGVSVFGLALDDTSAWFTWQKTIGGTLSRCALPTCAGGPTTVYSSAVELGRVATYGGWVYFTLADSTNGAVVACDTSDCAGTVTPLGNTLKWPGSVVADASGVYWTELGGGRVMSAPLHGGVVTTLASGQASPFAIATDATNVYWGNEGGTIVTCAKQGCGGSPTVLAHACFGTPYGIVVGNASVYWTEMSNVGAILEAPK